MKAKAGIIVFIIVLIPVYLYKSDLYLLKIARKARSLKINEYDNAEKRYIEEGSYCYRKKITETREITSQLGKSYYRTIDKGYQKITFSFTSNDLIIDYPYNWNENILLSTKSQKIKTIKDGKIEFGEIPIYKHVKEVIKFNKSWEYDVDKEEWKFYITEWQILEAKTGKVIQDILAKKSSTWDGVKYFVYLNLRKDNEYPIFGAFPESFKTVGYLEVHELVEQYKSYYKPLYSSNFSYPEGIYDLDQYKPRKSWEDQIKEIL